ncbi:type I polyketide synthase [Chelatococcus reniformis]|uniref:Polyketide synthase n=1 Tax=Chelatococcus reniformis TaxID=1494448 RepID=A0A916UMX2_9HYPH|nr:type I polyketide synthase [Chelatococcus reniformis]GGC78298.1 hypothetical protein GCM10010994_40670 [Chelatococcus reniformis]
MSDFLQRIADYSPKRLALVANELKQRVDALEQAPHEPVAIVGMGCRFPGGADTPELYWEKIRAGADCVVETPPDRWDTKALFDPDPDAPGKLTSRHGGFLARVDAFDPEMFGISRREAQNMDPQQRLLLEVAWEALENACIPASDLYGANAGIFVGVSGFDYFQLLRRGDSSAFDAYAASGVAHSIASGRLAYVLGTRGPALSIDTACSSSLMAAHVAVRSLRNRECNVALAGGVNLILTPETTVALSKARMMAPDGRCKAFDARADGFVRGEGCGVLVLKRLSDARAAGDPIVAVIRGTAANQDGRSNGLTAPNGVAQEELLKAALDNARIEADAVGYVEAHGTGTKLGDPIEALALDAAFGRSRRGAPVFTGSVKANIGHLESAAGAAGLIKLALMLRHGVIPPQIHFETPNPHVPWETIGVRVPRTEMPWPMRADQPRIGGVSSFGFSGTNAHLILEQAPDPAPAPRAEPRAIQIVTVSARTEAALASLAGSYASVLAVPGADLDAVAATATAGRMHLPHRAAVVAASPHEASEQLAALSLGQDAASAYRGAANARPPKIAFLFTGQGCQYLGMARGLLDAQPVFRAAMDDCRAQLNALWPHDLFEILFAESGASGDRLNDTTFTQPALFAVEYALAQLWASFGVRPDAVAGHSLGEISAACVAGMLSLHDALKLTVARGRLMGSLPRNGAMAAVMASEERVLAAIRPHAHAISVAALNGPVGTVISGDAGAVSSVAADLRAQGVTVTPLKVSHAFHSPLMDPILQDFAAEAGAVAWGPAQIKLASNVTGSWADTTAADPDYWCRHARAPVRFADGIAALAQSGCNVFIEIGPHPTLIPMAQACVPDHEALWLASLKRGANDDAAMMNALAALYTAGADIDWRGPSASAARTRLPNYPFQRERFWLSNADAAAEPQRAELHPLLGREVRQSLGAERLFEARLGPARQSYLADHRIHGTLPTPSPVLMEMALAAGRQVLGHGALRLRNFELSAPLMLDDAELSVVQTAIVPTSGEVRIAALGADDTWLPIATCRVERDTGPDADIVDVGGLRASLPEMISPELYYGRLAQLGLEFGPAFRGVDILHHGAGTALARVAATAGLAAATTIHPAALDACLHAIGAALPGAADGLAEPYLLMAVEEVRGRGAGCDGPFWSHVTLRDPVKAAHGEAFVADVRIVDDAGAPLAELSGVTLKRARKSSFGDRTLAAPIRRLLHEIAWVPATMSGAEEVAAALAPQLREAAEAPALAAYAEFIPKLDHLCALYVIRGLRLLGWTMSAGATATARDLADRLDIPLRHRRLFARMLDILREDRVLVHSEGVWRVIEVPETDPEAFADEVLAAHPDCGAELSLTRRCARSLAAVMRGETDPLALLFPGGSLADAERLYQSSPPAQIYNKLVADAVGTLAAASGGRPLRILEVGAGTGSTTESVLRRLGSAPFEYTFTDVSPLFLNHARAKFAACGTVRYELLDLEQDLAGQGFEAGSFDIVIGANVVHATRDLAATAARLRALLGPEGRLILLEGAGPQRFGDLTVGLLEGWWAYTDTDLRQYALMPRAAWRTLLSGAGFAEVAAIPPEGTHAVLDQQAVFVAEAAPASPRTWLLQPDRGGLAAALADALQRRGCSTVFVDEGDAIAAALTSRTREPVGVVSLIALDHAAEAAQDDLGADQERLIKPTLALFQALVAHAGPARFYAVTRGAQAIRAGEAAEPAQATLWGLSHVAALEHPELNVVRFDLDPAEDTATAADALARELCGGSREHEIAQRGGRRFARRLTTRLSQPARSLAPAAAIDPDGAYLITGGLRGLGLLVAEWLFDQGARSIALMGRGAPGEKAAAAIARMERGGANVLTLRGDVALRDDVKAALSAVRAAGRPLKGVFHCAGVLDDGALMSLDWDRFAPVLAPKVQGAWNLHALCGDLDMFVMFSSGASLAGSAGQANHAAANAFEDALAWLRQAQGQPGLAINWGPWADIGAAADRSLSAVGGLLRAILPQDGLAALSACLWRGEGQPLFQPAQLAVIDADWSALATAQRGLADSPLFWAIAAETGSDAERPVARRTRTQPEERNWRARIRAAPASRRGALLRDDVRALAARVLGASPRNVDVDQPLRDLGLDSLMAVELRNRLGIALGCTLPATITFDCPTITALVSYLGREGDVGLRDILSDVAPVPVPDVPDPYAGQTESQLAAALVAKLDALQLMNEVA